MPQWRRIACSGDVKERVTLVIDLTDDECVLLTRVNGRVCAHSNNTISPLYLVHEEDGIVFLGRAAVGISTSPHDKPTIRSTAS